MGNRLENLNKKNIPFLGYITSDINKVTSAISMIIRIRSCGQNYQSLIKYFKYPKSLNFGPWAK